jgi:hypothetical protein
MSVPNLRWPDLAEPYGSALREAVAFVLERVDPVGIVACGSVIRGTPNPNSDLDIYVIHRADWRQRIQRRFNTVPAEFFINPPAAIRGYFENEGQAGRPITAHMLSTGFVVLDRDPIVQILLAEAQTSVARTPDRTPGDLQFMRYLAADAHENGQDMRHIDPVAGLIILGEAVQRMVDYRFLSANINLPRSKERLTRLAALDPVAEGLVRQFTQSGDISERYRLAGDLADHILEAQGFFEWESARLPVG